MALGIRTGTSSEGHYSAHPRALLVFFHPTGEICREHGYSSCELHPREGLSYCWHWLLAGVPDSLLWGGGLFLGLMSLGFISKRGAMDGLCACGCV